MITIANNICEVGTVFPDNFSILYNIKIKKLNIYKMDENQLKDLYSEKSKETELQANELSIGEFVLKTHEETFNNISILAHDMATNLFKRYMMLTAESDGIDLILKVGGDKIYKDENFKQFIIKMNEYLNKIKEDSAYETSDQTKDNEALIYTKFKTIFNKLN